MGRLVFSGHESFSCKQFWLKKGFDFVKSGKKFNHKTSVVDLGVGKNMVNSIRFWVNVFGVVESKESTTKLGEYLFGDNGKDLYLEDIGSVWLLHYSLVKNGKASIYDLIFNEYQAMKDDFTKEQLHEFLKRKCEQNKSTTYNPNTINRDITVFFKNYLKPTNKNSEIEDTFVGLLHELDLLEKSRKENAEGKKIEWYNVRKDDKKDLPYHIVLFSILDSFPNKKSISFNDLLVSKNAPGRIFGLNGDGLYTKIKFIEEHYKGVVYSETAGNRTLQINNELNKWDVLNEYYN